jgi:alpha-maltose-1-phosphate synthase
MTKHRELECASGAVGRRLRIAIATSGRFHVLDLARELDALGYDVRLYSYVPRARAQRFGLPARCHVGLLPLVAPALACERMVNWWNLPVNSVRVTNWFLNRATIARMSPCDVFICMSGTFLEAPLYAQRCFGATVILERGSRHILSQRDILTAIPGAHSPSDYAVERELQGYKIADAISVPSRQVSESFERDPAAAAKLKVNPYGVDLKQFPLRAPARLANKTVLFAGNWIYRKGVDVLCAALEQLSDVHLIHVGALGDAPFPSNPRFVHHDPVPQWRLTEFYAQANVFVMPSREEGLALVQAQALASGLPLVCTDRTGGADLAHSAALAARIRVVRSGDVEALRGAIVETMDRVRSPDGFGPLPDADRQLLSWRGYGERYAKNLESLGARRSDERDHEAQLPE